MIDAGLVVSGLRLLLDGYKLAAEKIGGRHKDGPDPVKLEEVIADLKAGATNGPPDPVQVEHEIDRKFSPEQAQKIKSDLAAFALLADPPKPEEFDYWTALVQIANSLQAVAEKTELFGLRGNSSGDERYLPLEKTSLVFVPKEVIAYSLPLPNRAYRREITKVVVALIDSDSGIPLRLGVVGQLYRATSMGDQYQESVGGTLTISAGTEKNQLRLTPDRSTGDFASVEYRVTALQIADIVEAMRSDISDYAEEISNERNAARELAQNVSEIVQDLSNKSR
jgi:hypothetical protein